MVTARPSRYRRPATAADRARAELARADKLAALHRRLHEGITALRGGQDWRRFLDTARRLHSYSFHNLILIGAQRPDATMIAGYETWKQLGRQVDRGQKGIQILAPVRRRDTAAAEAGRDRLGGDGPPAGPAAADSEAGARPVAFRLAHVWDVSQTSGDPLPAQPAPQLLAGAAPDGLWDRLAALAAGRGFSVERGDCAEANGYTAWASRSVRVRDDVDDAQACKTLAHEVGHVLLHDPADFAGTTARCRGIAEVEAESVGYLIVADAGLDSAAYTFPYVTSWAADVNGATPEDVVAATGARVLAAARTVLAPPGPAAAARAAELLAARASAAAGAAGTGRAAAARTQRDVSTPVRTPAGKGDGQRQALIDAHRAAIDFYTDRLANSWVPDYLGGRWLGDALATGSPWALGYAPEGWTGLVDHLRRAGFADDVIARSGLAARSRRGTLVDRFRDRLMLGVRDRDGAPIAFIGRANPTGRADIPKYLNSPETSLYRKGEALFGLAENRAVLGLAGPPVLVEGALDVLAVSCATGGRVAALAPSGTALTGGQVAALAGCVDLRRTGVVVAFDSDAGGRLGALRAHDLLRPVTDTLLAPTFDAGVDPAGLLELEGRAALAAALTDPARLHPLADDVTAFRLDQLGVDHTDPIERRALALGDLAPAVAALPAQVVGRQIVAVAQRLDLDFATVSGAVLDAIAPGDDPLGRLRARDRRADLDRGGSPARPAAAGLPGSPLTAVGRHPPATATAVDPVAAAGPVPDYSPHR